MRDPSELTQEEIARSPLAKAFRRADEIYSKSVKEAEERQQKAAKVVAPSGARREELDQKIAADAQNYATAFSRILKQQGLPNTPSSRETVLTNALVKGANPIPEWKGYSPDEYTLVNNYVRRHVGKDYETAAEANLRISEDLRQHAQDMAKLRRELEGAQSTYNLSAIKDGKVIGTVKRTGTQLDKDFADRLPTSIEQALYADETSLDVLKRATQGLRGAPKDDASLAILFPDSVTRERFKQNALSTSTSERAGDLYVPLYQRTTRSKKILHISDLENNLISFYMLEAAKKEGRKVISYRGAEEAELRKDAEVRAKRDVSEVTADKEAFVYHHDPTRAKQDFLEGKGILGTLGKISAIRPFVALLVSPRKSGATISRQGQVVDHLSEKGFAAEILSDTAVTRAIDYFLRLAPSEAVGSAFTLAHKDYLEQFGDKAAGRGLWIARRMKEVWDSDRLASEIMHSMDGASPLLLEAGSVMAGEYGDKHPTLTNVLGGAFTFGVMLFEPDAFLALPVVGKLGKLTGRGGKTLREGLYGANKYLSRSGEILQKHLQPIDRANVDAVRRALSSAEAEAKEVLGTTDGVNYLRFLAAQDTEALRETAMIGKAEGDVDPLAQVMSTYRERAKAASELYTGLLDTEKTWAFKGELKDPAQAKLLADGVRDMFRTADAEIKTRIAAYDVAKVIEQTRIKQLSSAQILQTLAKEGTPATIRQARGAEEILTTASARKTAQKHGVDLDALRVDLKNVTEDTLPGVQRRLAELINKVGPEGIDQSVARLAKAVEDAAQQLSDLRNSDTRYLDDLKTGVHKAVRPLEDVINLHLDRTDAKTTLKEQVDSLGDTMNTLAKLSGEMAPAGLGQELGPALERVMTRTAKTFSDQLYTNAIAVQAMSTPKGKAFFEEIQRSNKTMKGIEAVKEAEGLADFQGAMKRFGDLDAMTEEEFLSAIAAANISQSMWNAPSRVWIRAKGFENKIGALAQYAPFWLAGAEVWIKGIYESFPLLSRTARAIPIEVSTEIDTAAKGISRRVSLWGRGIEQVILNSSADEAHITLREMMGTNDMMQVSVSGVVRKLTVEPRGSGDRTIVRLMFESLRNRAKASDLGIEDLGSDIFLQGLIKSRLPEAGTKVSVPQLQTLEKLFLQHIHANGAVMSSLADYNKAGGDLTSAIDDALKAVINGQTLEVATDARSQDLFYRNMMQGGAQTIYVERLAQITNFRSNELDISLSMNHFWSEGKKPISPPRGTPRVGELVVPRRTIDAWAKITDIESAAGKTVKARGEDLAEVFDPAQKTKQPVRLEKEVRGTKPVEGKTKGGTKAITRDRALERALMDEGFGETSKRILRIEDKDGVNYAVFADGPSIPVSELSVLPSRLGLLNAYDGFLRWGIDLAGDVGTKEQTNLQRLVGDGRSKYCEMVAVSADSAGNPIMIPKAAIIQFSQSLEDISKNFDNIRSIAAYNNPIVASMMKMTKKVLTWWRMHAIYGLLIPRPAHFMNNIVGDWAQMAINPHIGFVDATKLSLFGAVGYLPFGDDLQKQWLNFAKTRKGGGVLLPPILGALYNPALDDFFGANLRQVTLKDGTKTTTRALWEEALEAGVNENIRSHDWNRMLRKMIEDKKLTPEQGLMARGAKTPAEAHAMYLNITETIASEASRKQRGLLYFHARVNLGLSQKDATKLLHNALYDWTFSISFAERKTFAALAAFYVFSKNAFGQTFSRIFDGTDDTVQAYLNKWLKVQTTQQKLKAVTRFSNQILGQGQYISPGEVLSPEEQKEAARRTRMPDWTHQYSMYDFGTLDPEVRAIGEAAGVNKTNYVRTLPKFTAIEFANTYATLGNLVLGALLASVSYKHSFNREDATKEALNSLIDQMNPYSASIFEDWAKGMTGGVHVSEFGPAIRMDEYQMLSFFGFGTEIIPDKKRGVFRVDAPLDKTGLALIRAFENEANRARLFFTAIAGDTPLTPTSIKMLEKEGYGPRLEALAQLTGIGRAFFYNADMEQHYRLDDIRNELKARARLAERKSDSPLNPK